MAAKRGKKPKSYVSKSGKKVLFFDRAKQREHFNDPHAGVRAGRKRRNPALDARATAKHVGDPSDPEDVERWLRDPSRSDLEGIDTAKSSRAAFFEDLERRRAEAPSITANVITELIDGYHDTQRYGDDGRPMNKSARVDQAIRGFVKEHPEFEPIRYDLTDVLMEELAPGKPLQPSQPETMGQTGPRTYREEKAQRIAIPFEVAPGGDRYLGRDLNLYDADGTRFIAPAGQMVEISEPRRQTTERGFVNFPLIYDVRLSDGRVGRTTARILHTSVAEPPEQAAQREREVEEKLTKAEQAVAALRGKAIVVTGAENYYDAQEKGTLVTTLPAYTPLTASEEKRLEEARPHFLKARNLKASDWEDEKAEAFRIVAGAEPSSRADKVRGFNENGGFLDEALSPIAIRFIGNRDAIPIYSEDAGAGLPASAYAGKDVTLGPSLFRNEVVLKKGSPVLVRADRYGRFEIAPMGHQYVARSLPWSYIKTHFVPNEEHPFGPREK